MEEGRNVAGSADQSWCIRKQIQVAWGAAGVTQLNGARQRLPDPAIHSLVKLFRNESE